MLDANLKTQLKAYLEKVTQPFEIVASLDDGGKSQEMLALLQDIVSLSNQITLKTDGNDQRTPSFSLNRPNGNISLRFAGIPMGHEFTSLVLALLQVGGHPPKLEADLIEQIKGLQGEFNFETYFSQSCQNCPDVVQALNLMAVLNPNVRHVAIDGALFQEEVERRQIMSVPSIYLNGELFGQGRMGEAEILAKLDTGSGARDAEKLNARTAFDVLDVRVEHGHQVQRLDHVRAVLAGQREVGFEAVVALQRLDLLDHFGRGLRRVTADLQQGQHQRGELVAHGDAGKTQADVAADAVERERRPARIVAVGLQGDLVAEAGNVLQQAQHFPGLLAVIEGRDDLEGLGDLLQVGFQLGLEIGVQHWQLSS